MKALLDMPVSPSLVSVLEAYGYTGTHVSDLELHKAPDTEILELARETGAIVITADHDFPRLLALSAATGPGVILFRGGNYSTIEMGTLLRQVLDLVPPETLQGSICVVDKSRVRITTLPLT